MGGGSAPEPDKNIGLAALRTAEIGEDYLSWMQDQAQITNRWANEDRARYKETYEPLQDQFIAEAQGYDTPERRTQQATAAVADVEQQAQIARAAQDRRMAAMGVTPGSGRFEDQTRRTEMDTALAKAGAGNITRRRVEDTGRALRANAVNMGSGFAVNPATSIGISNSGMSSGANAAMSGNQRMGDLLNQDYQNRYNAWAADQQQGAGLWGALGTIAGALPWTTMLSSKEAKENKRPETGILDALKDVPVERWNYKEGLGDGGEHVGPYAEDMAEKMGVGDGKTIKFQDALGITMGAVKELDEKVDQIAEAVGAANVVPMKKKPGKGRGVDLGITPEEQVA